LICLPLSAHASSPILISEIYPSPNTGETEWIELYNPNSFAIPLTGYTIEDGTNKPANLSAYQIQAESYLVLEKGSVFTFALNNSGDTAILKNSSIIIDELTYGNWNDGNLTDNADCPDNGQSLGRTNLSKISGINFIDFSVLSPTMGAKYEKLKYLSGIVISEILPRPANGADNEFIELENISTETVDLSGWRLDDEEGGSAAYSIPKGTSILAGQHLLFGKLKTKIALNDDGDAARLFDPNGEIRAQIYYGAAPIGQSFARFPANFSWTTSITPNELNILTIPPIILSSAVVSAASSASNSQVESIAVAKSVPEDSNVAVSGTITVPPNVLSSQYGYLQDSSGGMQFYSYSKSFPETKTGDTVVIRGITSSIYGEKRIKTYSLSDISVISSYNPVAPKKIDLSNLKYEDVGLLVSASGVINIKNSDGFDLVDDGGGMIRVVVRDAVSDLLPKTKRGQRVTVTGILSSYKNELRILPFEANGVMIDNRVELPRTGNSIGLELYFFIGFISTWIFTQITRRKQKV
jgi:DNA/RNA endonuclease YhcR with UshA esterase domain